MKHGASAYRDRRACRCDVCRSGNTERARRERAARAERLTADPTVAVHGSAYTYRNWGCRCGPCTAAHTEYHRRRRSGDAGNTHPVDVINELEETPQ